MLSDSISHRANQGFSAFRVIHPEEFDIKSFGCFFLFFLALTEKRGLPFRQTLSPPDQSITFSMRQFLVEFLYKAEVETK